MTLPQTIQGHSMLVLKVEAGLNQSISSSSQAIGKHVMPLSKVPYISQCILLVQEFRAEIAKGAQGVATYPP